jgi:phage terminase small subunit
LSDIKSLTARQRRFCEEYIIDLNATQAAIRAGFSAKTARCQASKLFANVAIEKYVADLRAKQQKRTEIDADAVLKELATLGFSKITNVLELDKYGASFKEELSEEAQRSIESISVSKTSVETDRGVSSNERLQVKMHSKISALKVLGQHLGIFNDLNAARTTLAMYGDLEVMEDGSHVFRPSGSKASNASDKDEVSEGPEDDS